VKQEGTRTHSQGSDHTVDWTADGQSTFPQLPIDICGFDVIGELEIRTMNNEWLNRRAGDRASG
jgi:hypothetical protein